MSPLQVLATEVFKVINGLGPIFMKEVFKVIEKKNYPTRNVFHTQNIRTVYNGTETLTFLGPKIWAIVPDWIKESNTILLFKQRIKKWKPIGCPCRICKIYLNKIGFIK